MAGSYADFRAEQSLQSVQVVVFCGQKVSMPWHSSKKMSFRAGFRRGVQTPPAWTIVVVDLKLARHRVAARALPTCVRSDSLCSGSLLFLGHVRIGEICGRHEVLLDHPL